MNRDAAVKAGQPDQFPRAGHVSRPQLLIRIDEIHQRARMVNDVDGARQLAEDVRRQAKRRRREVAGHRHDAVQGQVQVHLIAPGRVGDPPPGMSGVLRPYQAVDPRGGGRRQRAQQVNAEKPGGAGEEYLARSLAVRRRSHPGADRVIEFGVPGEVSP